jgi:myo-inositol-1(or 4)-monophosphatase
MACGTLSGMDGVRRDRLWLAELEEFAAAVTAEAGEALLGRYRAPIAVEFKDEKRTDPVTEADRAIERLVRDRIRSRYPEHGVLGEEGTAVVGADGDEYLWVLDPLDGTANFAGRLPFFAVSLALLRNGVPVVGCLFVPFSPRLRAGVMRCSYGNGATLDSAPLRLEATEFRPAGPVALPPQFGWTFRLTGPLAKRLGEPRNTGSICYELAMVAGGGFQYAAFAGPRVWDVAAGVLLVREAGGEALTWRGRRWRRFDRFAPPPPRKDGNPTTLRDWARPVLVVGPGAFGHVVPNFRPRPLPPRAARLALRRTRAVRRWWTRRRSPPEAEGPTAATS